MLVVNGVSSHVLISSFHFFSSSGNHVNMCAKNRMPQPVCLLSACIYVMGEGEGSGLASPGPGSCCQLHLTQVWPQLQPHYLTALPEPGLCLMGPVLILPLPPCQWDRPWLPDPALTDPGKAPGLFGAALMYISV